MARPPILKRTLSFLATYFNVGRQNTWFPFVFALVAAASLLPIWRARFLPLLDEPNHLSAIYVWHFFDDPAARLQEFYELRIRLVPYMAYYLLVHATAFITSLESANKLVLSAYVLSIPTAALLWTRRTRRSPWLSILTFPLAYSYSWSYGFHPFNVGIALFLFALIALDAFLERPSPLRALTLALLALLCDLGHFVMLCAFFVCVPCLWIAWRPRFKTLLASIGLIAPSAALFAWQVSHHQSNETPLRRTGGEFFSGQYLSPVEMLRLFPTYTLDSVSGSAEMWVFGVIAGSAGLLLIAGMFWLKSKPEGRGGFLLTYRGALLALAMTGSYFALPLHLHKPFEWWFVSGRFAPLVCFFIFLLPRIELRGYKRLWILPTVCAAFYLPVHISEKYVAFNERAAPFVRMMEATKPGKNILYVGMKPPSDPAVNIHAYNQFGAWTQILRGGFSGSGWFTTGFPFEAKRMLPGPPWYEHEQFKPSLHAGPYDYVIVHNEKKPVFGPNDTAWKLVQREGQWCLYERITTESAR